MSDYMQYVEKFARDRCITPEEAEEHYIVKLVKRYYEDLEAGK